MRKSMADLARNRQIVLSPTLEDNTVYPDIKRALQELGFAMTAPDPLANSR